MPTTKRGAPPINYDVSSWRTQERAAQRWQPGAIPDPPRLLRGQFLVGGFLDLDKQGQGGLLPDAVPLSLIHI